MIRHSAVAPGRRVVRLLLFNRLSLLILGLLMALVLVELGLRGFFAARVGAEVLLYGTPLCCGPEQVMSIDRTSAHARLTRESHTVHVPGVELAAYRKYRPNQTKLDYSSTGESFEVRINNHGFRGEDFELTRRPGELRVVTLGASSTFGYRSRDDETYPFVLQQLLNERLVAAGIDTPRSFEVINLGMPHMWSGQIRALLEAEALPLVPDVVTLYTGMNDAKPAARFRDRPNEYRLVWNPGGRPSLGERFLAFARRPIDKLSGRLITAALVQDRLPQRGVYDTVQFRLYSGHKVVEFIDNVAAMRSAVEQTGATFIAVSQQAHYSSDPLPSAGVTYGQNIRELRDRLAGGGKLTLGELEFVTHGLLMEALEAWCRENSVPFVDGIAALDARRDLLASYVHLTPEANRLLAAALADEVWRQTIGRSSAQSPRAAAALSKAD